MQTLAIIFIVAGFALAAFIGLPLRTRLGRQLGQDDFPAKLDHARKAGDPLAKRLFLTGWASGALIVAGAGILIFGRYFQGA